MPDDKSLLRGIKRSLGRRAGSVAVQALKTLEVRRAFVKHVSRALGSDIKQVRKQLAILWRRLDAVFEQDLEKRFSALRAPDYRAGIDTAQPDSRQALLEVLELVGVQSRAFVDIGCGRSGGQSHFLAQRLGWRGLFVDASEGATEAVGRRFAGRRDITARCLAVTPENVAELVDSQGGDDLDLLNIDIDSYDYWIWKAIASRPRVVVIEYNAYFGRRSVTVPLGAVTAETPKGYSGASLGALAKLGAAKGYLLLGCDHMGANAFFAREDLLPASYAVATAEAWRVNLDRCEVGDSPRHHREVIERIEAAGLTLEKV